MKSISDELWIEIEKFLPEKESDVGRPEMCSRTALNGILFVLKTGIQWHNLPEKYGKPSTVHGKFMKWCRAGVFEKILIKAREYYRKRNSQNIWYAFDTLLKKGPFAQFGGANPTDRSKQGVKQALLVDRKGAPLFVYLTAANVHDSKTLEPIINQLRRSKRVRIIAADSAFDVKYLRSICADKKIALLASTNPRRSKNKHIYKPLHRWIIERSFGWFA